jgi:Tfp pilus assembly protein PilP
LKPYLTSVCKISLVISLFFVSLFARNPFSVPSIKKAPRPTRRVVGILEVDGVKSAILCVGGKTKIVREGDRIDQYKVVKIDRNKIVTMRKNNEEETWSIDTL